MKITPKTIRLEKNCLVSGISVRTTNNDEFDPNTAKLSALWGQFFTEDLFNKIPNKSTDSPVYGVYSDYESNEKGAYQVTAGVAVDNGLQDSEFTEVQVQAGEYLVFENSGELPQAVIDTWMQVWTFFEANPQIKRRFATDFELYLSDKDIAIYIGIEHQ